MYMIVKTYEQCGVSYPKRVLVRIHHGTSDGLENYWADWNREHPGFYRFDEVAAHGIVSMKEAISRIRAYC